MNRADIAVGLRVVYRTEGQPARFGTVTSIGKAWVFVRYDGDPGPKATAAVQLAPAARDPHTCTATCWDYLEQHGIDAWSRACNPHAAALAHDRERSQ